MSRDAPCPRSSEGRWRRWADYQRDKLPLRDEASAGRHLLRSSEWSRTDERCCGGSRGLRTEPRWEQREDREVRGRGDERRQGRSRSRSSTSHAERRWPIEERTRRIQGGGEGSWRDRRPCETMRGFSPAARQSSTPPSRGWLFGELKRARSKHEVEHALEALSRSGGLRDAKERSMEISAWGRVGEHLRAVECLQEMTDAGVAPDVISFNAAISACEKAGRWQEALQLLDRMKSAGVAPNAISFSAAMSACVKGAVWGEALTLLQRMRETPGVEPNVWILQVAIHACKGSGRWEQALQLLEEICEMGETPDVRSYNAAMSACVNGEQWGKALSLLQQMRAAGVAIVFSLNVAIHACKGSGRWEQALQLLEEICEMGETPDVISFSAAMSACVNGEQWGKALSLLQQMRAAGVANVISLNVAILACKESGRWEQALQLLEEICQMGETPGVISFSAAMSACVNGEQWDKALSLLQQMRGTQGVEPDVISLNVAIHACKGSGRWEQALQLIDEICEMGETPGVISFSAAISACAQAGQWQEALLLLDRMRAAGLPPNVISFNAAISACGRGQAWDEARALHERMKEQGVAPCFITYNALIEAARTCFEDVKQQDASRDTMQELEEIFRKDRIDPIQCLCDAYSGVYPADAPDVSSRASLLAICSVPKSEKRLEWQFESVYRMVRRVQPLHETMSLHLGVRTGDLTAALSKRRFDILYVSGHGADDKKREGGIVFAGANKAGKLHSLSAKALGDRLCSSGAWPRLIYLDFCESDAFAAELRQTFATRGAAGSCIVAWSTRALDSACFLFCSAFFSHFGACVPRERQGHPPDISLLDFDRAIAQAFDKGKRAMEEEYECRDPDGASLAPGRKPGGGMPVLRPVDLDEVEIEAA